MPNENSEAPESPEDITPEAAWQAVLDKLTPGEKECLTIAMGQVQKTAFKAGFLYADKQRKERNKQKRLRRN